MSLSYFSSFLSPWAACCIISLHLHSSSLILHLFYLLLKLFTAILICYIFLLLKVLVGSYLNLPGHSWWFLNACSFLNSVLKVYGSISCIGILYSISGDFLSEILRSLNLLFAFLLTFLQGGYFLLCLVFLFWSPIWLILIWRRILEAELGGSSSERIFLDRSKFRSRRHIC